MPFDVWTDAPRLSRAADAVERATGMDRVKAKAKYLNMLHYMAANGRWDIANAHVWRIPWLYDGQAWWGAENHGAQEYLTGRKRLDFICGVNLRVYHRARRAGATHREACDAASTHS